VPVRLERVTLPGELERSELVGRIEGSRLEVYAGSRWAAPLDGMVRRVLSADLAARLPPGRVVDPYLPLPAGEPRALMVSVHELYGDERCAVSLSAAWVLSPPPKGPGAVVGATEEVQVPSAGRCPGTMAATMSQALAVLGDRIAARIAGSQR
jgi:uncharacterized lipoprotein YmbA